MNNRCKVGIAIALLLPLFNQAFIQFWLAKKEDDAKVINIAGKQRMLSQRINLMFYHGDAESGDLRKLFNEWEKVNNGFLFGDDEIGIHKTDNEEVEFLLTQLVNNVNYTKSQLEKAEKGEVIDKEKLFENQSNFLVNMHRAVKLLENDSNNALFTIKITEIVLMLFSMLVLVLEVVLIYRPINKELQNKLSELEEKNEAVEKNNIELARLNESLEEYSFITAHDLSEPVRKISVYTQELDESIKTRNKQETAENLQVLNDSAQLLTDYFNGVLEFNAIDSNKSLTKQKLSSLVNLAVVEVKNEFPDVEYDLTLKTQECDNLKFDQNELPALIYQVIKNSFVYRTEGQPLKLIVGTEKKEDSLLLYFEDDGIGVDMDFEHKVFQMFQRLHGRKEFQGHGVGLALCKKIVETAGGEISFEKGREVGSKLIIKLPLSVIASN